MLELGTSLGCIDSPSKEGRTASIYHLTLPYLEEGNRNLMYWTVWSSVISSNTRPGGAISYQEDSMLGSYTFVMILCLQRRTQQWLNHVPQIFPSITAVVTGECTYQTVGCNVWSTKSCGATRRCFCQVATTSRRKSRGVSCLRSTTTTSSRWWSGWLLPDWAKPNYYVGSSISYNAKLINPV